MWWARRDEVVKATRRWRSGQKLQGTAMLEVGMRVPEVLADDAEEPMLYVRTLVGCGICRMFRLETPTANRVIVIAVDDHRRQSDRLPLTYLSSTSSQQFPGASAVCRSLKKKCGSGPRPKVSRCGKRPMFKGWMARESLQISDQRQFDDTRRF